MQQYSWSHCSLSMHSASRRLRKASRDSLAPFFLLMRSTMPSATAFWMGTSWRDHCESDRLPSPIFTPATKAPQGQHDENISFERMVGIVGRERSEAIRRASLRLYEEAAAYAAKRGIIIADTKFEFGMCNDELMLIDEILTPDSSRFWPMDGYAAGRQQPS